MTNNICDQSCCHCTPGVVVTQTIDGIRQLANVFVRVLSNNTTYFVSSSHEITIISSSPVYADNYNAATNPLGLREQTVYDFANNIAIHYNALGEYRTSVLRGGE